MKIMYSYAFILYMLLASFALVQAQTQTITSKPFKLQLEKDETAPDIIPVLKNTKESKGSTVIRISDNSGIDTIWIDDEVYLVDRDTLFELSIKTGYNHEYQVKAVDIKGNTRGVIVNTTSEEFDINNAKYYALLIGVENYPHDDNIGDLTFPIDDAEKLSNTLTSTYTFHPENVKILKNPTRSEIERAFDFLLNSIGENDNLLIFFAGHGSSEGNWYPFDAKLNAPSSMVRISAIREYIKNINSRHTLLIADACFSGSIFFPRGEVNDAGTLNEVYNLKSRKAITSGALQQVPDNSAFIKSLLVELKENRNPYLRAGTLFDQLLNRFMLSASVGNHVPQYGYIRDTENEGGDFIFIKR